MKKPGLHNSLSKFLQRCAYSSSATRLESTIKSLRVSEIFTSIQGEGPHLGRPSVFLRLGICNLSCVWCDTPYTWLFSKQRLEKVQQRLLSSGKQSSAFTVDRPFQKSQQLNVKTVDQVYREVSERRNDSINAVVITGGEPLLHKEPLLPLVNLFLQDGLEVEFETNGTISPLGLPPSVHFNISPKLSSSLEPEYMRLKFDILQQFSKYPSVIFKFVISQQSDLDEIQKILSLTKLSSDRIYLMPEGTNSTTIQEKGRWLVELCKEYGFNYSHRLHVELWGSKRGI